MKKGTIIFLLSAVFVLALGVRLAGLDRCFLLDEFRTIKISALPINEIFKELKFESYPPLTFVTLSLWMRVMNSDAWIRLLFVLFGAGSVVTVYFIGKELAGERYGIIAAFLMALMPMQVWSSQYVRGISPAIFFLLLSTLFFFRLMGSRDGKRYAVNAAGYAVSSILAVYSFYFVFFAVATQNIIFIYKSRKEFKKIAVWLSLQAVVAISFLPWLNGFLSQMRQANVTQNFSVMNNPGFSVMGLRLGSFIRAISGFLGLDQAFLMNTSVSSDLPKMMVYVIVSFVALAAAYAIFYFSALLRVHKKQKNVLSGKHSFLDIGAVFFIFAVVPLVSSFALNIIFKTPITPRYFAISSAFMIFVYASILIIVRNKRLFYILLALFLAISLLRWADFTKPTIDYRSAAVYLRDHVGDKECLLFIGGDNAYAHYAAIPKNFVKSSDYIKKYKSGSDYSLKHLVDSDILKRSILGFKSIWIYNSGEKGIGIVQYVRGVLVESGYSLSEEHEFKNIKVFKYDKIS